MPEFDTVWTDKDAYVDEADGSTNFGSSSALYVRSFAGTLSEGANRRSYVGFDITGLELPEDIEERIMDAVVRFPVESHTDGRTLELHEVAPGDWSEGAITWANQPQAGELQDTEASGDVGTGLHAFVIEELFLQALDEGRQRLEFVIQDAQEDAATRQTQTYLSREGGDSTLGDDEPELQIVWKSAGEADLSSQATARLRREADLDAQILPRFPRSMDLDATVKAVFSGELTGVVGVRAVPIEDDHLARAAGRVKIALEGVLDDVEAIFDEVGSIVNVEDEEVRAIVQLVDEADIELSTEVAGDPARLSPGDARLFALGEGSTFEPGDIVTWQGLEFRIVGALDEEHITDEAMFRELGLRLLATAQEARAIGTVSSA